MAITEELRRYYQLADLRTDLFIQKGALELVMDEEDIAEFEKSGGRRIGVRYQSPYNILLVDLVKDKQGNKFAYERVVPAVDAPPVVMMPVYNNKIVLTYQFRHAVRGARYAFPRGFGSKNLDALANARKELAEELGAEVSSAVVLGKIEPDTGLTSTAATVVCCELSSMDCEIGTEGIVGVMLVSPDELGDMIAAGEITDGFTLGAWAMYQSKRNDR